jgi:GTPase SAR1 family protein
MSGQRVDVKVVMLGKEYVGKTSLVERYVHDRFLVGPYQNVSASGPGTVGGGSLHPRPDVRRRPDSDFGYLGESFGNMILGKPVPEALRPTSY